MEIVKPDDFPMSSESDEDLLVIMSIKEDTEACHAAFVEFHRRYKNFLYGIIKDVSSLHPNKVEVINVVFNATLLNIYKYCDSFNRENETDSTKISKKIMGWLATIAKTEYKAQFTKSVKKDEEQLVYKNMLKSSLGTPKYSYSEEIVGKALDQIPKDRDRDIFKTYWTFYEKGEKSQAKNMPEDVLKDLSERYNTTPDNIRTIISRTYKIVKTFLLSNYKK